MSFCCENPIDLGCRSACAPITTNIVQTTAGYYTIVFEFNGALISREFYSTPVGGYLQIPDYIFNESSSVTFQIYDSTSTFIACFKANILPGDTSIEPSVPTSLTGVATHTQSGNVVPCSAGAHVIQFRSTFTPTGGIKIGTIIDLDVVVQHGGNAHAYSLFYDAAKTLPIINNQFVCSQALNSIGFYCSVIMSNCNQNFTIDAVVHGITNMVDGYYNTTNTYTQYAYNH